jgi:hypothetical protein
MNALSQVTEDNGEWVNTKPYKRFAVVSFTANGITKGYMAINPVPAGTLPTDKLYWICVTWEGKAGQNGVVTEIAGSYCFQVENGHLYLYYPDDVTAPNFSIENKHLFYEIL